MRGRPRSLSESKCAEIANQYIFASPEQKRQILKANGLSKATFYKSLKYYGYEIQTTKTLM